MRKLFPTSIAMMIAILSQSGTAVAQASLPLGVKRILLGQAVTTKDPAKGMTCTIPKPLSDPVRFEAGVTEIAYVVEVDPGAARQVKTSIIGDVGTTATKGSNCNAYSICAGSICQTQFGSSLSRSDGRPLKPGSYTLSVDLNGQNIKVPFSIK